MPTVLFIFTYYWTVYSEHLVGLQDAIEKLLIWKNQNRYDGLLELCQLLLLRLWLDELFWLPNRVYVNLSWFSFIPLKVICEWYFVMSMSDVLNWNSVLFNAILCWLLSENCNRVPEYFIYSTYKIKNVTIQWWLHWLLHVTSRISIFGSVIPGFFYHITNTNLLFDWMMNTEVNDCIVSTHFMFRPKKKKRIHVSSESVKHILVQYKKGS